MALFGKEKKEKVDIQKDLQAIGEFLADLDDERKRLFEDISKARELFQEAKVVDKKLLDKNLSHHIEVFDNIVKDYESFQNDVNINGIRVKNIAKDLLRRAKERGLLEVVKEKRKDSRWRGNW